MPVLIFGYDATASSDVICCLQNSDTDIAMSVSTVVLEKLCGNKVWWRGRKRTHFFGLFGIALKWLWHGCLQLFFDIYMHSVEDDMLIQYLINFIFLSFFWDCQKSALIAIPMTPAGSISFNTWLRCYHIVWCDMLFMKFRSHDCKNRQRPTIYITINSKKAYY